LFPVTLQPALTEINRTQIVVKQHKWGQTLLPAGRLGIAKNGIPALTSPPTPAETAEMAEMMPGGASRGSSV
jgi:hypothetical protein